MTRDKRKKIKKSAEKGKSLIFHKLNFFSTFDKGVKNPLFLRSLNKLIVNIKKRERNVFAVFSLLLIFLTVVNFSKLFAPVERPVLAEYTIEDNRVENWNQFLSVNPDYFQGWVELAKLEIEEKDYSAANKAYLNAMRIDPNSEDLEEIEALLNGGKEK